MERFKLLIERFLKITTTLRSRSEFFLIALFLFNICFKFYNISLGSFDLDEAWHTNFAQAAILDIIKESSNDPNPPLYNILLGFWIHVFGVSETGARAMSVLLSSATAPLIFLTAKRFINLQTGFWASLLYTASDQQFYFSHDARVYALEGFLTVLSFYSLFNLMEKPSLKSVLGYILVLAALLYTHTTTVLLFPVHFTIIFFWNKENRKQNLLIAVSLLTASLLFSIWILYSPYYHRDNPATGLPVPGWKDVVHVFKLLLNNELLLYSYLFLLLIFLIHTVMQFKKGAVTFAMLKIPVVLFFWMILPVIGNYIISFKIVPIFLPKYLLYISPGIYLLWGYMVSGIPLQKNIKFPLAMLWLCFFFFSINVKATKLEDWRSAVHFVKKYHDNKTLIAISPYYQFPAFSYYYDLDYYRDYKHTLQYLRAVNIFPGEDGQVFSSVDKDLFHRAIVVTSHESVVSPVKLLDSLHSTGLLANHYSFDGINVYVFRLKEIMKTDRIINLDFENQKVGGSFTDFRDPISQKIAFITDSTTPYSRGLEFTVGLLPQPTGTVQLMARVLLQSKEASGKLICSIENLEKVIFYYSRDVGDCKASEWQEIAMDVKLDGPVKDSYIIKCYVWNTGSVPILVDKLEVNFKE